VSPDSFRYENIDDAWGYPGFPKPPLEYEGPGGLGTIVGEVYLGGCVLGLQQWYRVTSGTTGWNWRLYAPMAGAEPENEVTLTLNLKGYRCFTISPEIRTTDTSGSGVIAFWQHCCAGGDSGLNVLYDVIASPRSGQAVWRGTYPCGNPDSITVVLIEQTGALAEEFTTLPSEITLLRG
jgi:hypothetical protein